MNREQKDSSGEDDTSLPAEENQSKWGEMKSVEEEILREREGFLAGVWKCTGRRREAPLHRWREGERECAGDGEEDSAIYWITLSTVPV